MNNKKRLTLILAAMSGFAMASDAGTAKDNKNAVSRMWQACNRDNVQHYVNLLQSGWSGYVAQPMKDAWNSERVQNIVKHVPGGGYTIAGAAFVIPASYTMYHMLRNTDQQTSVTSDRVEILDQADMNFVTSTTVQAAPTGAPYPGTKALAAENRVSTMFEQIEKEKAVKEAQREAAERAKQIELEQQEIERQAQFKRELAEIEKEETAARNVVEIEEAECISRVTAEANAQEVEIMKAEEAKLAAEQQAELERQSQIEREAAQIRESLAQEQEAARLLQIQQDAALAQALDEEQAQQQQQQTVRVAAGGAATAVSTSVSITTDKNTVNAKPTKSATELGITVGQKLAAEQAVRDNNKTLLAACLKNNPKQAAYVRYLLG